MRILHTADWHLGKSLEGYSRMDEQEAFLKDFIHIVKENHVDMVIISGDIYDNPNPPARAEKMFYNFPPIWYNEPCRAPCWHREPYKANNPIERSSDMVQ